MPQLTVKLKVPEGMTPLSFLQILARSVEAHIGENERPGREMLAEKQALSALLGNEKLSSQRGLTRDDLAYLRRVNREHYGLNDYMKGWRAEAPIREKLENMGLVKTTFYSAAPIVGDCDGTSCKITQKGREALKAAM